MGTNLRTFPHHRAAPRLPWVQPFDGVPPRRLDLFVLGSLVDEPLPCSIPPDPDIDVVVSTGSLTDSALGTLRHLRAVFLRPLPIVLVLCPEEFQGEDLDATLKQARRSAAAHGVTLLDDAEAIIRSVRFVGATLWTDFRLHGTDDATVEAALAAAGPTFYRLAVHQDGRQLTTLASTGLDWRSRNWLGLALPGDLPTVVVIHHPRRTPDWRPAPASTRSRPRARAGATTSSASPAPRSGSTEAATWWTTSLARPGSSRGRSSLPRRPS